MAPIKKPPLPLAIVRNKLGITFSFNLIPSAKSLHASDSDSSIYLETPNVDIDHSSYHLEPAVHNVTCISLVRRMNRMKSHANKTKSLDRKNKLPVGRKRKVAQLSATPGECIWCGTHKTAQWRKGPTGARGLCNRCGIEWAKQIRIEAKNSGVSNNEAEDILIELYKSGKKFQKYKKYSSNDSNNGSQAGDSTQMSD
ncbi:hypothetical protein BC833DRAFT_652911 [Globomyces pollinis-pini]|nr:hypothetical protein BC833DRAFT_652911 [Globomyces pollinis-pini]